MDLQQNHIHWIARDPKPVFEAQVISAVFKCNENWTDVTHVEIKCEDGKSLYFFEFDRASKGFVGNCSTFDIGNHQLKRKQATNCALINLVGGGASLLAGVPMEVHGRRDLYWIIRTNKVIRNLK